MPVALLSGAWLSRRRGRSHETVLGRLEFLGSSKRDTHPQNCNFDDVLDNCPHASPLPTFRPQFFFLAAEHSWCGLARGMAFAGSSVTLGLSAWHGAWMVQITESPHFKKMRANTQRIDP